MQAQEAKIQQLEAHPAGLLGATTRGLSSNGLSATGKQDRGNIAMEMTPSATCGLYWTETESSASASLRPTGLESGMAEGEPSEGIPSPARGQRCMCQGGSIGIRQCLMRANRNSYFCGYCSHGCQCLCHGCLVPEPDSDDYDHEEVKDEVLEITRAS